MSTTVDTTTLLTAVARAASTKETARRTVCEWKEASRLRLGCSAVEGALMLLWCMVVRHPTLSLGVRSGALLPSFS